MVQGGEPPYVRCCFASDGPRDARCAEPNAPNQASADPITNNSQHAQVTQVEMRAGLDVERQAGKAKSLEMTGDDTVTAEQFQENTELGVARMLTSMYEKML